MTSSDRSLRKTAKRLTPSPLPPFTDEYLGLWSFTDGKQTPSTQMRDIVIARTDANIALIEDKLRWYAKHYDLGIDALKELVREKQSQGLSNTAIHAQLAEVAGVPVAPIEEIEL